jgi:hypothetical protein
MKFYIKLTPRKDKMKSRGWAVWPFLAVRADVDRNPLSTTLYHEEIHIKQQLEMLVIPWLLLYGIFWVLLLTKCPYDRWRLNPMEQEAIFYQDKPEKRKAYGWIKFLKMKNK